MVWWIIGIVVAVILFVGWICYEAITAPTIVNNDSLAFFSALDIGTKADADDNKESEKEHE